MKLLKEKFLHILDVRWHLPFIIAVCFNFLALISSAWFLSLLQFDVLFKMIFLINILLLFFLIVSLIYQLSKKRWLRALITIVYSYLHFIISFFVILIIAVGVKHSTGEDEENKWIEEQKNYEKSDETIIETMDQ